MATLLLRGSTWLIFVAISVLAVLIDLFGSIHKVGTQRIGFPFRFYESTSAPPPAFGSSFYWTPFLLDLLVYYVIAVAVTLVWSSLRGASGN